MSGSETTATVLEATYIIYRTGDHVGHFFAYVTFLPLVLGVMLGSAFIARREIEIGHFTAPLAHVLTHAECVSGYTLGGALVGAVVLPSSSLTPSSSPF